MDPRLPIQSPPIGAFSSLALQWSEDGIAHIPFDRLSDFQDGEGRRIPALETTFFTRAGYHRPPPTARWLVQLTMWCSFGPQHVPAPKIPTIPPRKGTVPTSGVGSRPRARKSLYNNHIKRGCQCHYKVTQFKDHLDVAVIRYINRDHINEAGKQCHGSIREATVENPDWSIRCQVAPRLSTELKKHLLDLLRAGMTVSTIHDLHCTQQMNRSGLAPDLNCSTLVPLCTLDGRDDLLHKRDLHNLNMMRQRETTRRHDNDLISIQKWIDAYPERVVIHRQYCIGPPEVEFILALQSPWQLAQMVELSHGRALALDSTFAITKYGFPFFTLVCFDRHQMGLPAAWSIQLRETANMISEFLQAVKERAQKIKPDWMPSCFIIDCAKAEVNALKEVFPEIPIYFCSWHVRRAWKEALVKKAKDKTNIVYMNDDLGPIMYAESEDKMWERWQQFRNKYKVEKPFLEYFADEWLRDPDKWMRAVRTMNRANQNTNGATEAWHLTLKKMIARCIGGLQSRRLDALVPMLFGPMLAFFMYNMKRKQLGYVINYKVEEIVLSSLHLAEHELKHAKVTFPDSSRPDTTLVQSATTDGKEYVVRNIYSYFPSCECQWADQGNMCKHQVKALLVRGHAGGTIVEQMGTRFGSNFDGILPPPTQVLTEVPSPTQLADHTHDHLQDELPSLQLEHEEDVAGMVDLQHTADETLFPAIQSPPPTEINPQVFHDLIAHMTELVGGNSQLFQNAVASLEQTNNNLAQMRHSQTLTGKDVTKTNDRFVKPLGLTSKRRLGVIDLYHGGKRGKRTQAHPKKRRTAKNKEVPAPSQVDEAVVPDPLPARHVLRRESFREELNRHRHAAVTGTSAKRTAKNAPGKIPMPPKPPISQGGLRRYSHFDPELDLNV